MYLLKGNVDEISRELVNNPFYIFFSQRKFFLENFIRKYELIDYAFGQILE